MRHRLREETIHAALDAACDKVSHCCEAAAARTGPMTARCVGL